MVRKLRVEYPGAVYHIVNRGNRRENIFIDSKDRKQFLQRLLLVKNKYNLVIHGFCLMDNHYHLIIETPEGNISTVMRHLNSSYANYFRIKHRIYGSIFQGRFKSFLVEKERYILDLSCYIHLNPVRANLVKSPEQYEWSSYRIFMDEQKEDFVSTEFILGISGGIDNYKYIVESKMNIDSELSFEKGFVIGSDEFKGFAFEKLDEKKKSVDQVDEIPELNKLLKVKQSDILKAITDIFGVEEEVVKTKQRNNYYFHLLLFSLKQFTNLSLKEIGNIFKMKYSAISEQTIRFEKKSLNNRKFRMMIEKMNIWYSNFKH